MRNSGLKERGCSMNILNGVDCELIRFALTYAIYMTLVLIVLNKIFKDE